MKANVLLLLLLRKHFWKSTVKLTKKLEIKTIAEYVETPSQYKGLLEMGVDCGQGYLFGKGEMKPNYKKRDFTKKVVA